MPDPLNDLTLLIRSRHPIVTIETVEETRAVELVTEAAKKLAMAMYTWTIVKGLESVLPKRSPSLPDTHKADQAFAHMILSETHAVFVCKDMCRHLKPAVTERLVRDVAERFKRDQRTLIFIEHGIDLPPALDRLAMGLTFGLPDREDLADVVKQTYRDLAKFSKINSQLTRSQFAQLVDNLRGLTRDEAVMAVTRVILDDDCLNADDIPRLLAVKKDMIHEAGLLDYISTDFDLESVGGLDNLKVWLAKRRGVMSEQAKEFNLDPPKGILVVGMQGCGKSMIAKAVAKSWNLPLLKMDPGQFYDKYVGQTERNMRDSLRLAESMAPVVLWIDEIEKAFASAAAHSTDGGLSQRMFGTLLGWMQDRKSPIFVVATANDISALPPELLRKGRFDELFFVDLPGLDARLKILEVHLRRRNLDPKDFDIKLLASHADGFSGAEIEQVVVAALYSAFADKRKIDTQTILNEIADTNPLSVTMAERAADLRHFAKDRFVPADT